MEKEKERKDKLKSARFEPPSAAFFLETLSKLMRQSSLETV
jgi:hypothetical protein